MRSRTVYLSGGMQFARGTGASWRADLGGWIRRTLGHRVIDPVIESEALMKKLRSEGWHLRGRTRTGGDWPQFFRQVVDRDCRLVRRADYIVCLWDSSARRGAGTQGELTIAREQRIPVYLVTRSPLASIPGWIQGCSTERFGAFNELRTFLQDQFLPHHT